MLVEKCKKNKETKQQGGRTAYSRPCKYLRKSRADNLALALKFPINCVLK